MTVQPDPPKLTTLPTPADCLLEAADELKHGEYRQESALYAEAWIRLARELREGSQRPLVDRALDRLTLHDVEGIVCSHGRVAVRRRGGEADRWFMHTDDRTNCGEPDQQRENKRRMSQEISEQAHKRWIRDADPADATGPPNLLYGAMPRTFLSQGLPTVAGTVATCRPPCNQSIHYDMDREQWVHLDGGQTVCPSAGPQAVTTFAEPASQG